MADYSTNIEDTAMSAGSGAGPRRDPVLPELRPGGLYRLAGKRILDLALALLMLPLLLPVMALIALAVRSDGGPAFFVQDRVGRGGRVFRCLKFRTMIPDAEAELARLCAADPARAAEWARDQKLRDDPRITRAGRFLRQTSLDELPQILNVLKGEMSLVGPRPFLVDQAALYAAAGGRAYLRLRPGITGPWQIEGRGRTSFVERIRYDDLYFARLSLGYDLALMWRTLGVVLARAGS